MKWIYLLLVLAFLAGCNDEDELTPSEGEETFYKLPQGNHDYDSKIVDYNTKYGFYILYEFGKKDLFWNNMSWSEFLQDDKDFVYVATATGVMRGKQADQNYVGQVLDMCEKYCFEIYPEEYLKNYMPLRFLICSNLGEVVTVGSKYENGTTIIIRDTVKLNVYRSFNRLAVNWASTDYDTIKPNDKLYFSKDLNDAFMSILKENNVFEYDNGFMMTGHIYTYAQLQGENLFKRGFLTTTTLVNGNITQSRINDFMAFLNLAMVPLDILNAEPVAIGSQDNNPSVVGLFSRVYADADDGRVDGKTGIDWIKQKYNFVINLLKKYGIDTDKLQHPEI